MAAASPLHGRRALRTVPLPLRRLGQTHAAVVEPLDGTLRTTSTRFNRRKITPRVAMVTQSPRYLHLCYHSQPSRHKRPAEEEKSVMKGSPLTPPPRTAGQNLVADAVSGLVGVVGPVHLAVGLGLG